MKLKRFHSPPSHVCHWRSRACKLYNAVTFPGAVRSYILIIINSSHCVKNQLLHRCSWHSRDLANYICQKKYLLSVRKCFRNVKTPCMLNTSLACDETIYKRLKEQSVPCVLSYWLFVKAFNMILIHTNCGKLQKRLDRPAIYIMQP